MKIIILVLISTLSITIQAQLLTLQGIAPKLYLQHKVASKDNMYSIGRLYNVNARELATYNNINLEKLLVINQQLKVPLTIANFAYDATTTDEIANVPVHHIVEKSEGLYRLSLNAGTTMQVVRQLNGITNDAINTGTALIVGYLKVKKTESSLVGVAVTSPTIKPDDAIVVKPVDAPIVTPKETPKPKEPVVIVKEQPKAPVKETVEMPSKINNAESYFKKEYTAKQKEMIGTSATFKTIAGWADNKYYALMDGVTPGSIIQITSSKTNKTVYAKVLGEMQELKQNNGLILRISNATAAALDVSDETFDVIVKY